MTALHWAAFHGRTGHVRLLVEKKADLLSRDTDGKLPLHWAAQVFNFQLFHMNIIQLYGFIDQVQGQGGWILGTFILFLHVYGLRWS